VIVRKVLKIAAVILGVLVGLCLAILLTSLIWLSQVLKKDAPSALTAKPLVAMVEPVPQRKNILVPPKAIDTAKDHNNKAFSEKARNILGKLEQLKYAKQLANTELFEPCQMVCNKAVFDTGERGEVFHKMREFLDVHGADAYKDPKFNSTILMTGFAVGDFFPDDLLSALKDLRDSYSPGAQMYSGSRLVWAATHFAYDYENRVNDLKDLSHRALEYSKLSAQCGSSPIDEIKLACESTLAPLIQ
jgi:hypothetical protein